MTAHTFKVGDKGMTRGELIDEMANRFLCWKLPSTFAPDMGISFTPIVIQPGWNPEHCWPTGTNLFNDPEVRAMFEQCLPPDPPTDARDAMAGTSEPVAWMHCNNCKIDFRAEDVMGGRNCPHCKCFDQYTFEGHSLSYMRVYKDGNVWCATKHDFINLQESHAGFGDTPSAALSDFHKPHSATQPNPELEQARAALAAVIEIQNPTLEYMALVNFIIEHGPVILRALENMK